MNKEQKALLEAAKMFDVAGTHALVEESNIKANVFASLLENQKQAAHDNVIKQNFDRAFNELNVAMRESVEKQIESLNEDVPTISTSSVAQYDPVMISMLRRTVVDSVAYEVAGVQPMKMSSGLIFSFVPRYPDGTEAFKNEPNTAHTGKGAQTGSNPAVLNDVTPGAYTTGTGKTTAELEALGTAGNDWAEMKFTIEKTPVTAQGRGVRAEYSTEMMQDLKTAHGMDAGAIIADLLGREVVAEQNRQITRSIYISALEGAEGTTVPGIWDIDADSTGRWVDEHVKSLVFQLNRDSADIFDDIKMGRGNFGITTLTLSDALAILPQFKPMLTQADGTTSLTGSLNGKKIIVDPYISENGKEVFVSGYKGNSELDAGMFFSPYMGLEFYQGTHTPTFQPTAGAKSRYGLTANPFATASSTQVGDGVIAADTNQFFRRTQVKAIF